MKKRAFTQSLAGLLVVAGLWSCQKEETNLPPSHASARTAAAYRLVSFKETSGDWVYTTNYTYDANNRLVTSYKTTQAGKEKRPDEVRTYDYSQAGVVTETNGSTLTKYTLHAGSTGQAASQIDNGQSFSTITYDSKDRITQIRATDGYLLAVDNFTYDSNDNLIINPSSPGTNVKVTAEYDLGKLNLRPVPDVEDLGAGLTKALVGRARESKNLLVRTAEPSAYYKNQITVTTYAYEFNADGYVTKKTRTTDFYGYAKRVDVYTYTYEKR